MKNPTHILAALSAAGNFVATEILEEGFPVTTRAQAHTLESSGDLSYLSVMPVSLVPLHKQWDEVFSALSD